MAQSHTPCNRCVRFAATVASGHATLATKQELPFTWAGLAPAGSHQLAAGAPTRSPRRQARTPAIFTSPCFRGGRSELRAACVEKRIANQDLVRVKAGNLLIGQGQELAQELFVMLAETIGGDVAAIRPSGKFHRQPGDVEFADPLVPDPPDRSALAQLRLGHGLVEREYRRGRRHFP